MNTTKVSKYVTVKDIKQSQEFNIYRSGQFSCNKVEPGSRGESKWQKGMKKAGNDREKEKEIRNMNGV